MKLNFILFFLFSTSFLTAQVVIDFEDFNLPVESFLNGSDGNGGFTTGDIFLPNDYNPSFMSWTGWSISNTTDVTTPGFTNQYSSITGGGANGSATYAVNYAFGNNNMILEGDAAGQVVSGMYITNNTYAYLSMQDGDSFAKRFGGLTGDDPDFFLLTVRAYSGGNLSTDSVNFYLADYRFDDNNLDYIVDEWTYLDLSSLGPADSLSFSLTSSDVGSAGMNTPAYFCVDDVFATNPATSTQLLMVTDLMDIYPNPTADFIQISRSTAEEMDCTIYDAFGRLVHQQKVNLPNVRVDLQHLPSGNYSVRLQGERVFSTKLVVKR
ncbi:MAG: DUF4465 domain-containing protein [Bacteroidota bacterium]